MRILFLLLAAMLAAGSAEAELCDSTWLGTASGSAARDLIGGGADVDQVCDTNRNRPLHRALLNPRVDPDVIRALMGAGADPAVENVDGASPIRYAQERFDRARRYFRAGTAAYGREQSIYDALFDRAGSEGRGRPGIAASGGGARSETRRPTDRGAGRRGPPPLKTGRVAGGGGARSETRRPTDRGGDRRGPPPLKTAGGAGSVFRDCPSCPEMVMQPGERLALGRFEVTRGEYAAFVTATQRPDAEGCSWRDPGFEQTDDRHPVVCVSWDDAQAYAAWLSAETGIAYRLATDSEWYAAGRGTSGGCGANGGDILWHREWRRILSQSRLQEPPSFGATTCSDGDGAVYTAPVGSYSANGVGLFDMVGNVAEWTADCSERGCDERVTRGGGWGYLPDLLPPLGPELSLPLASSLPHFQVGFRVARPLE